MNGLLVAVVVEALAFAIVVVVAGFLLRRAAGRRILDEVALIRCHEDRQAALRRNADDKLVRLARMLVGAVEALPAHYHQSETAPLLKTADAMTNYLDHLDGKVPR